MDQIISRKLVYEIIHSARKDTQDVKNALTYVARLVSLISYSQITDNKVHLCASCRFAYPECCPTNVIYGDDETFDNICCCSQYIPYEKKDYT